MSCALHLFKVLINQLINLFVPKDAQAQINDIAALFGLQRNDFLLKSLKQLQALEKYAKIDLITLVKKAIKFSDERLLPEHVQQLEAMEDKGIQFGKLVFSNQIQPGQLNKIYDLIIKAVRLQIDGQTVVDQLPALVDEILLQNALGGIMIG
jgi:hypothetical protein